MTCLPPALVKSPVWLTTIFQSSLWSASMISLKPLARSSAGAAPVVPSSCAIFTAPLWPAFVRIFSSILPARRPSSMKSEPMKETYRESSAVSMERSVRMTGIFAVLASLSTASQPVTTTGEKAMTSTFCAM